MEREKKKELSEAKRLASFTAKRQLELQRQAVISESLKDVDSGASRKIVFESDSEEEKEQVVQRKPKHLKLFDDDDDDAETAEATEELIVNRHFGKKGAKLAMLEARFGHDSRFKLDEKFVSDEEEEEEADVGEKEANLAILSKVLGKTVTAKKASKKTVMVRRFDPENEQHIQWLESRKNAAVKKPAEENAASSSEIDSSDEKKEAEKEAEARVVEGRFFEVNPDFAEVLKKKMKEGGPADGADDSFSFLKSVGRESSQKNHLAQTPVAAVENNVASSSKLGAKKELPGGGRREDEASMHLALSLPASSDFFFLNENDAVVKNIVSNFRRRKPVEEVRKTWTLFRESIVKFYKGQRKSALRAMRNEMKGHPKAKMEHGIGRKRKGSNRQPNPTDVNERSIQGTFPKKRKEGS